MKAQLSRNSHRPEQRYSGVYQQQGRMITDADWNELVDIVKRRQEAALQAAVGSGVPARGGALAVRDVRTAPGRVAITAELRWGALIVDGIAAEVVPSAGSAAAAFLYTNQRDFPDPPAALAAPVTFYADVWERLVVSLQDDNLRDPALHGADTCVRTQVLAQVKCAASAAAIADPDGNPQRGDARFSLDRPDNATDAGDPCVSQGSIATDLGNYLFRLEVHDVVGTPSAPTEIVLKWSSENAAEAHPVADAPPEFEHGDWVYEFFNDVTERHLGVHLGGGAIQRSVLVPAPFPDAIPDDAHGVPMPLVRRWDGSCRLRRQGVAWTFVQGTHLGQDLAGTVTAPGAGTPLTLSLGALRLGLDFVGRHVVAGDYWLALMREHPEGRPPEVLSAEPVGVVHHYLPLLGQAGASLTTYPVDSASIQRLSFPALTELSAARVAYDPGVVADRWTDIDDGAAGAPTTVQDAIDQLVGNLEASDIGYTPPTCDGPNSVNTLLSTLARWPDLDGDGRRSIKDMLDALLCRLDASRVPYQVSAAGTVFDAIEARVKKAGDTMTGDLTVQANVEVTGNIGVGTASAPQARLAVIGGGLNVGGPADPGAGNLLVTGRATALAGLTVGPGADPGAQNLLVTGRSALIGGVTIGSASDPGPGNLAVGGNCVVTGDLTVNGTTTTLNTTELNVEDRIIRVNRFTDQTTPHIENAGLEVFRGGLAANPNAQIVWDETQDHWMHGVEGNLRPIGEGQRIVTGTVRFPNLVGTGERFSQQIDPGLGGGRIGVVLGVGRGASSPGYGDVYAGAFDRPSISAIVNENTGMFQVRILRGTATPDTYSVRWWAFKASDTIDAPAIAGVAVTLSPTAVTMHVGDRRGLIASVSGTMNPAITWTSTNLSVATVDSSGFVHAIGVGTAVIIARSQDEPTQAPTAVVTVQAVAIVPSVATVQVNLNVHLALDPPPDFPVSWSSANSSIAAVNVDGIVIGINPGTVQITARSQNDALQLATAQVTVVPAQPSKPEDTANKAENLEKIEGTGNKAEVFENKPGDFGGVLPDGGDPIDLGNVGVVTPIVHAPAPAAGATEPARPAAEPANARTFIQPHERPDVEKW